MGNVRTAGIIIIIEEGGGTGRTNPKITLCKTCSITMVIGMAPAMAQEQQQEEAVILVPGAAVIRLLHHLEWGNSDHFVI